MVDSDPGAGAGRGPRKFLSTRWSLVRAAADGGVDDAEARAALEALCRDYWYPLYAYVRSRGHPPADAQDLTQAFFARMLETGGFAGADRRRGRFRSYLLGALKHFLANQWQRARAVKRGGRVQFVAWDGLDPEPRYTAALHLWDSPDHGFDREWAVETVARATAALREEMEGSGKGRWFAVLEGTLTGEEGVDRERLAEQLGLSPAALKVAIHRLRRRYRELLRSAIAETVETEADVHEEMRYLLEVLRDR